MIWGVAFGFFIFGDRLDNVWKVIGIFIIIASGLFVIIRNRKKNKDNEIKAARTL
jgi:drug/metabolite transporter (DMT)-like permease